MVFGDGYFKPLLVVIGLRQGCDKVATYGERLLIQENGF